MSSGHRSGGAVVLNDGISRVAVAVIGKLVFHPFGIAGVVEVFLLTVAVFKRAARRLGQF